MKEHVILVDEFDQQIGVAEKLTAHRESKLHRAFSVFLFNPQNELLLQQRALQKYHSGGLWSNTCCGHPRPGEDVRDAALRRMSEEMDIDCPLQPSFDFIYRAVFDSGLVEHELDHVFLGRYNGSTRPNPDEVMAYQWLAVTELEEDLESSPQSYTPWLKMVLKRVTKHWDVSQSKVLQACMLQT